MAPDAARVLLRCKRCGYTQRYRYGDVARAADVRCPRDGARENARMFPLRYFPWLDARGRERPGYFASVPRRRRGAR